MSKVGEDGTLAEEGRLLAFLADFFFQFLLAKPVRIWSSTKVFSALLRPDFFFFVLFSSFSSSSIPLFRDILSTSMNKSSYRSTRASCCCCGCKFSSNCCSSCSSCCCKTRCCCCCFTLCCWCSLEGDFCFCSFGSSWFCPCLEKQHLW